jgi:hypothetical protein
MVKERDNKDASEVKTSGVGSAGSCEDRGAGNEDIDQEVAEFRHESRKIRKALSGIENTTAGKLTKWVNIAFIAALGTLFSARFVFDWIDYTMSIELGILLVSMKMISRQAGSRMIISRKSAPRKMISP